MKKYENKFNLSLLYVEDEKFIRENAVEFLSGIFTAIYEAEDGKMALDIYKQHKPDIIITDIQMPKLNGLELCRVIRQEDDDTPIIITTAYAEQEYLLQAVELNLVKYLTKPIEEETLLEALALCVQKIEKKEKSIYPLSVSHVFDALNQTLFKEKEFVKLTRREKDFLSLLIQYKERIVTYNEIERVVFDSAYMSEDALKTLVKNLRRKTSKECIENHSKLGYKIKLYHG